MSEFDWRAWTPRLAKYYEALLRAQAGRGNSHLHDVRKALRYGLTADLASFTPSEAEVLEDPHLKLKLEIEQDQESASTELDLAELQEESDTSEDAEGSDSASVASGPDPQAAATLRRIARKQRNDPHNRETLLGFPLIGARIGGRLVCGPLLIWEMSIDYDPRNRVIDLRRRNTSPDLNTILLGKLADDPDDISLANERLLPLLLEEDFGPSKIPDLMKVLTGIFTSLSTYEEFAAQDYSLKEFLQQLGTLSGTDPAIITMRPILTNGPRSYAFLLSDLRQIAAQSNPGGESVLAQIVGDVPREGAPQLDPVNLPFDDTSDGGEPIWFPFPSNRAQREAAQTAARVNVLTVQGPPGTGKSQTIANLVCHLVTEGHSVLVTSHQRKAMEVLSNMLRGFEGLALSMLSGDQESLQRLRTQLEGLQDRPPDHMTAESVERGQAALLETDRDLRRLTRRFMELRRLEHEEFPSFALYENLRQHDLLSPADPPVEERSRETASHLQEWARHYHSLLSALPSYDAVFRPDGAATSRIREEEIARRLVQLIEAVDSLDTPVSEAGRAVAERLTGSSSPDPISAIGLLEDWLKAGGQEIERNLRDVGAHPEHQGTIERWAEVLSSTRRERIDRWSQDLAAQLEFARASSIGGSEYEWESLSSNIARLRKETRLLSEHSSSLFPWFFSRRAARSRRWLRELGFEVRWRTRRGDLHEIGTGIAWLERYSDAESTLEDVHARLPLAGAGQLRPRRRDALVRAIGRALTGVQTLIQLETIPMDELKIAFGEQFELSAVGKRARRDDLAEALSEARRWILRHAFTGDLLGQLQLPEPWNGRVARLGEAIREGSLSEETTRGLEQLRLLVEFYPNYRRMLDLEMVELNGLSNSLHDIRSEIEATGEVPGWLHHAEKSLEAHSLSSLLRGSLKVHPDNLEDISAALNRGQEERRARISEIIRRKRELATFEALQIPAKRVPLLGLRKLLRRKRLNESLLALRSSIDYDAVLSAFPCWICTIADAARLFPPRAGLFDYLIVDEASQCQPGNVTAAGVPCQEDDRRRGSEAAPAGELDVLGREHCPSTAGGARHRSAPEGALPWEGEPSRASRGL